MPFSTYVTTGIYEQVTEVKLADHQCRPRRHHHHQQQLRTLAPGMPRYSEQLPEPVTTFSRHNSPVTFHSYTRPAEGREGESERDLKSCGRM